MHFKDHMIFDGQRTQVLEMFGGPPETRTPDPLIKSPYNSEPERNINKKIQRFRHLLAVYSTMVGVCSALVLAQNQHTQRKAASKIVYPSLPHFVFLTAVPQGNGLR